MTDDRPILQEALAAARFEAIFRSCYPRVLAYVLRRTEGREVAEEIVSETFLIATKLRRQAVRHKVVIDLGPPRQGDVLEAIKAILAEHPDGLRQSEVRKQVEQRLGRKVVPSTVRTNLFYNAAFERIGYGLYRLVSDENVS